MSVEMYGCDIDQYLASIRRSATYQLSGANMIVASLMSDAQEELAMGRDERVRQTLNCAKAVLFEIMDGNLVGNLAR